MNCPCTIYVFEPPAPGFEQSNKTEKINTFIVGVNVTKERCAALYTYIFLHLSGGLSSHFRSRKFAVRAPITPVQGLRLCGERMGIVVDN